MANPQKGSWRQPAFCRLLRHSPSEYASIFVRLIVRGKAGKPVEFGAKLDISVVDGWTRLECCSFDAYNEAGNLQEMVERFRAREGHYPSRILTDKIYRNRENLSYCKAHGIRLSGPALGRPKKGETRDKAQDYRDECERMEVERRFSLAKRKCGMGSARPFENAHLSSGDSGSEQKLGTCSVDINYDHYRVRCGQACFYPISQL